jgi:bacillithiol biosynthesis cysteine-adding enzyme BshC
VIEVECIAAKVPKLIKDYLAEDEHLKPFYAFAPNMTGLQQAAQKRSAFPVDRSTLVRVLQQQQKDSAFTSEASKTNTAILLEEDVFTITTGHQLCVLGGPLFFFYKILSAVKLSEQAREKGLKVVPVYWMASEDHDFEEIRSTQVGDTVYDWGQDLTGPVGRHALSGFQGAIEQLRKELNALPGWEATGAFIAELYAEGKTLAQATRDLVHWAFSAYGVVVIDADDPALKALFKKQMEEDIRTGAAFNSVEASSAKLNDLGHATQVTPRRINLFYMKDGYRERLDVNEEGVATVDGKSHWSMEDIIAHLAQEPASFSPNVVLRPMYQEVILPNLCYVGGPGELSYWLQLKAAFDHMNVFYPQLVLRDMVVLMDAKTGKRMEQLKLNAQDVYRPEETILKEKLREIGTHEYLVDERKSTIDKVLKELEAELEAFDPTLAESTRAEHQRIVNRLAVLQKKVLRADKRQNETLERRLGEWKAVVHPNGVPQERVLNWLSFFTESSLSEGLDMLYKHFDPLDGSLKVATLK